MKLENTFEVPLPPPAAWALLLDIERIAPCLPGASITEIIDDKTYKGQVALRLGPVALSFVGKATFVEIDDAERCARITAQGADNKGRGGANAEVRFRIAPAGDGAKVIIDTDLNLSGSIAQYGRGAGIIQATAEQLVGQFADNLRRQLSESTDAAEPGESEGTNQAAPIAGFGLMFRVLWNAIKRLFSGRPQGAG